MAKDNKKTLTIILSDDVPIIKYVGMWTRRDFDVAVKLAFNGLAEHIFNQREKIEKEK